MPGSADDFDQVGTAIRKYGDVIRDCNHIPSVVSALAGYDFWMRTGIPLVQAHRRIYETRYLSKAMLALVVEKP
jgi:hypothetical protein